MAQRRNTLIIAIFSLAAVLTGCGGLAVSQKATLSVVMLGVFEAPTDAVGDGEPKHQIYSLTGVSLTNADDEVIELFKDDAKELRIVSRSQVIYETEVTDYVGQAFSAATVTFDPSISGAGASGETLETTLTAPTAAYTTAFTFEKAKAVRLTIEVQWKNTIESADIAASGTETMTPPTFDVVLGND